MGRSRTTFAARLLQSSGNSSARLAVSWNFCAALLHGKFQCVYQECVVSPLHEHYYLSVDVLGILIFVKNFSS